MTHELLPPQPYYLPGYTGWCPQYKHRCGRSFSHVSHSVLTDPNVSHSEISVLADVDFGVGSCSAAARKEDGELCESCRQPVRAATGYQGFKPCLQHYFGMSLTRAHRAAMAKFENRLRNRRRHLEEIMKNQKCFCLEGREMTKALLDDIKSKLC